MKKLYLNPRFLQGLLIGWLALLYLPGLSLMEIPTDNGGIPVSFCYLFSMVFLPLLFFRLPRLRIPPWPVTGLYLFVLLWAAIQAPAYGLSKSVLHWAFGLYVLLVLVNIGDVLSFEQIAAALQTAVLIFFACHLIYNIVNWRNIYQVVFQGTMGSALGSLTRGGRNLDASWLGLGCLLVRNKKLRLGCLLYSAAYTVIGVSRAGIIATGVCLLWILIYDDQYGFRKKTAPYWCGLAVAGLAAAFGLGLAQRMYSRIFLGTGEGAASFLAGRENMWANIWPMFQAHPFGVGVGNAMRVMRLEYGFTGYEDVVHNVLFQMLLDEGVIGALWFLGLAGALVYSQMKRGGGRFRQPLAAYLLGYLLLSTVQFHGGEALMIVAWGCYLVREGGGVLLRFPGRGQAKEERGEAE